MTLSWANSTVTEDILKSSPSVFGGRAGYYSRAWQWEKIKANAKWITQFHSTDDPFIPPAESRHVAQSLRLQVSRRTIFSLGMIWVAFFSRCQRYRCWQEGVDYHE